MVLDDYERKIVDYYETCDVDYKLVWHLRSAMAMHYGYWEPGIKKLRDALRLMNTRMAEMAGLKGGEYVLDAGCGIGGSSIYLAANFNCKVQGITLSGKQVNEATQNALKNGVSDFVSFNVQNYCHSSFADNTFDVVWALESVCHAREKLDFIKEAYRILKPGGKIIVADFFRTGLTNDEWMRKWANSWAVGEFEHTSDFLRKLESCNFHNIRTKNISEHIVPSVRRLYYYYYPGAVCDKVLRMLGLRSALQQANMKSTLYQYKAFSMGSWQYHFCCAQK